MVGRSEHRHALVKSWGRYNAEELDRSLSRFMELVQQVQDSEALIITDPKDPRGRFSSAWWNVFQPWWDPGKKMPSRSSKHGNFMEFRKPAWWPKMVIRDSFCGSFPPKRCHFCSKDFPIASMGRSWLHHESWSAYQPGAPKIAI